MRSTKADVQERASSRQSGFTLLEVVICASILVPIVGAVISITKVASETASTNLFQSKLQADIHRTTMRMSKMLRSATLTSVRRKFESTVTSGDIDKLKNAVQKAEADLAKAEDSLSVAKAGVATNPDPEVAEKLLASAANEVAQKESEVQSARDALVQSEETLAEEQPKLGSWVNWSAAEISSGVEFRSANGELWRDDSAVTEKRRVEFVLDPGETENGLDDDGDGLVDEGVLQMTVGIADGEAHSFPIHRGVEKCEFSLEGRVLSMALTCVRTDSRRRMFRVKTTQRFYIRNN